MNYYYITGTSRGIGKALAEQLLKNKNNYVIGISRTKSIESENYEHINLDISDLPSISDFQFIDIIDANSITLINNAGVLGDVREIGGIDNSELIRTFHINTVAPSILTNNFIAAYQNANGRKVVLNVSSGAGRRVMESWSGYCASKAALDMFSNVANSEQKQKDNPIRIFSVAPGVVETQMQEEIRSLTEEQFAGVQLFVDMKQQNTLSTTDEAAANLIAVIENCEKYSEAILDVREL